MANQELDSFLSGGEPAPVADPPAPAGAAPAPTPAPEPQEKPAAPPAPKVDDDDADPPEPREGEPVVPRKALEDERHKRQDWKARAIQHETEAEGLRRQLAEIKAAPREAPPAAAPALWEQPVNPATDPQAYHQRVQGVMLNERLNLSELLLRKELGSDAVDAAVMDFKAMAQGDPTLFGKLYQQPDPYGWMVKHVERLKLQREIGDDPARWREAERERLRQELAAEAGNGAAPRVSPVAGLPPSLANARSALPRSSPAYTGPQPLDDILAARKLQLLASGEGAVQVPGSFNVGGVGSFGGVEVAEMVGASLVGNVGHPFLTAL